MRAFGGVARFGLQKLSTGRGAPATNPSYIRVRFRKTQIRFIGGRAAAFSSGSLQRTGVSSACKYLPLNSRLSIWRFDRFKPLGGDCNRIVYRCRDCGPAHDDTSGARSKNVGFFQSVGSFFTSLGATLIVSAIGKPLNASATTGRFA